MSHYLREKEKLFKKNIIILFFLNNFIVIIISYHFIYYYFSRIFAKRGLKMRKKGSILVVVLMLQISPLVFSSDSPLIYFEYPYDLRDYYLVYDSIIVSGVNFEQNKTYAISLIKDITLTDSMSIPESIPDSETIIISDSVGNITKVEIWNQWNNTGNSYLAVGSYQIIVDVDDDGIYDEGVDVVGSTDIRYQSGITSRGFPEFSIPEVPGGTIFAVLAFLVAAIAIRSKRAHRMTLIPIKKP
jgi:hypothetical protein